MKATKAYKQAMAAQRNQAQRGSSAAPLPGWRQVGQMKPGWTVGGGPRIAAPERAPLTAPPPPRIGNLGVFFDQGGMLGVIDPAKIVPALLVNFGITWAMLEVFPSYLKDKLDARSPEQRQSARWKIILTSAGILTTVNSILIPWFGQKGREKE